MEKLIYVADDEEHICSMIKTFLENEGYSVETFSNGCDLDAAFRHQPPDLLILDIMMPDEDGLSICSRLRKESPVPIIIISAKNSPLDRVTGLTLGCDDYITKPFLPLELIARIKALFRRTQLSLQSQKENLAETYECGNLVMEPGPRKIQVADKPLSVTPMEFDFLLYLLQHKEKAVEKGELLRHIWNWDDDGRDVRMSDDLVKRLRKKLRSSNSTARIETVWGYGYRLTETEVSI